MIIAFPRHRLAGTGNVPCLCHLPSDKVFGCMICAGGVSFCDTCGGAESSLPSHCPQQRMPQEVRDSVQDGELDYHWRRGWTRVQRVEVRRG